ncbi:AMP-binding protein [Marinimicrobium agarilyticum]|uniref:AMP-binding protein n=1 Tax=Marinimicrobium agarilyticum TaxID=306546 RepID=UPI00040CC9B7|nr:AMP-binding protein [Marinimicrobium agarilyticum]
MKHDYDRTVVSVLDGALKEFSQSRAFTCLGHTLTYRDIDRLSSQFAAYLQQQTRLQPGDRIAIQLPNVLQYPVVLLGALRAGLVVVNTNPLYTAREVKHQLQDSGAKALVVLANIADRSASIIEETDVEQVIVTELADLHPPVKRVLLNAVIKYIKKMVPKASFPNAIGLREALGSAKGQYQPVDRSAQDVAVLQYTGGTTGVAKGAMLTNRNLVANMYQVNEHMEGQFRVNQEFYVAPLPLYHIYAFTLHITSAMSLGNHNLLIPNPRDIKGFVKSLKGQPFTCFVGLNTLFNALCRNPDFRALDFSHLRLTASGGMALTAAAAKRWKEVTGVPIYEGYGLTETSPVVSINPPGGIREGTVGVPLPETECRVIDDEGNVLPQGESGELCVHGPQVMKGYWNRPEETEASLSEDGWFKTGDMAIIEQDGYIRIVDRKKDMINVSGFKVFPNEVEDVLCTHPDIVEAAVVGVPDEESGELVKAYIVTSGALTEEAVRAFAKENLTAYKVPHAVEFRDELPKSNVGKVLRRELRDEEPASGSA